MNHTENTLPTALLLSRDIIADVMGSSAAVYELLSSNGSTCDNTFIQLKEVHYFVDWTISLYFSQTQWNFIIHIDVYTMKYVTKGMWYLKTKYFTKATKLTITDFTVASDMYSSAFTFKLVLSHKLDISLCETSRNFISRFQSVNMLPVFFIFY
jgi:hypothetical protein